MSIVERRARLARRHGLVPSSRARDLADAAERVVGLHATDPTSVYVSAHARAPTLGQADIDRELYESRTVVRHLGMRRTLFVLPRDLVPVVQRACTDGVAATIRRKLAAEVERAGIAHNGNRWIDSVFTSVRADLADHGPSTGSQLSTRVPILRTQLDAGTGPVSLTPRLLTLLSAEGGIVRDRPVGSWVSSQHRWMLSVDLAADAPSAAEATIELVRRWLRSFGPAPMSDIVWWTGLGAAKVRRAVDALGVAGVELEGVEEAGLVLADDLDPEPAVESWIALLPSLDATPMGWRQRDWFLGPHASMLFDRSGNIGPTVWSDGRVVGGWAQRRTGEVVVRMFEDVGRRVRRAIDAEAANLVAWLGTAVVSPRFPTPLDKELRA